MKYGVYSAMWCYGTDNFSTREYFQGGTNFCTTDLNFAFRYREDIEKRNSTVSYDYEVREVKQ